VNRTGSLQIVVPNTEKWSLGENQGQVYFGKGKDETGVFDTPQPNPTALDVQVPSPVYTTPTV
jgi:hypothetical protein